MLQRAHLARVSLGRGDLGGVVEPAPDVGGAGGAWITASVIILFTLDGER